jgi:hypothetical protein
MFRRGRRIVRPIVRPVVRAAVATPPGRPMTAGQQNVPPALRRANELMAAGQYAGAAEIFEQFAHGAQGRGGPRAPQFFLQAGRCRVLAGQVPAGMVLLKQGLAILATRGDWQHLQNAGQRTVAELNQRGLAAEAADIEAYLKQAIPGGFAPAGPAAGAARPRLLPTACPDCGGPLRADEVEWTDEYTAACQFCGSAVRAE